MNWSDDVDQEEERIRLIVRHLPDATKAAYFERYQAELRDPDTFAVLSYMVLTGFRHVYLGDLRRAAMDVFAVAVGFGLLIWGGAVNWVGALPLAIVFVLDLRDLFRSQQLVKAHNNRTALRLIEQLMPGATKSAAGTSIP